MDMFWCLHPSLRQNPKNLLKIKYLLAPYSAVRGTELTKHKFIIHQRKKGKKRKAGLYLYFNFLKTF